MDESSENINAEAYLPASIQNKNKSKKRPISDDDKMNVDDDTGFEGSVKKHVPKSKRKKFSNSEFWKIPLPAHRLEFFDDKILLSKIFISLMSSPQMHSIEGESAENIQSDRRAFTVADPFQHENWDSTKTSKDGIFTNCIDFH